VPSADVVGLYSCGPTVYYFPHLGNMRAYVFADTLRRALRWKQIPVRHVVNITDVGHAVADSDTGEDKLEVAAAKERRSVADIASQADKVEFNVPKAGNAAVSLADEARKLALTAEEKNREHGSSLVSSDFTKFDDCLEAFKDSARSALEELQERAG